MPGSVSVTASLHGPSTHGAVMETAMVEIEQVNLWYGPKQALKNVTMSMPKHRITAYIGPSGCGKSTLLRCLNRMNDLVDGARMTGSIRIGGTDIYDPSLDVTELRKRVGMVFQKSNPFPKSIFENVAYGPRVLGARPHCHRADRRIDARPEEQLHDRDRDPQHAAGGAGVGLHGLHAPRRAGGIRRDAAALHQPAREEDRGLHHRPVRVKWWCPPCSGTF